MLYEGCCWFFSEDVRVFSIIPFCPSNKLTIFAILSKCCLFSISPKVDIFHRMLSEPPGGFLFNSSKTNLNNHKSVKMLPDCCLKVLFSLVSNIIRNF